MRLMPPVPSAETKRKVTAQEMLVQSDVLF